MSLFWKTLSPSTTPPTMGQHQMILDETTRDILLYGQKATTPFDYQTWKWDGTNWSQESPVASPSTGLPELGWDGNTGKPMLVVVVAGAFEFWQYDWVTPTWTQVFPATVPVYHGVVSGHQWCWFPAANLSVFYVASGSAATTYTYDGTDFTDTTLKVPTNSVAVPVPSFTHTITNANFASAPTSSEVVYYGGNPDGITNWLGTSTLDSGITAWTFNAGASYSNTEPGPRGSTRTNAKWMAYLSCIDALAVWGDGFPSGNANTWLYTGGVWVDQGVLAGTPFGTDGSRMTTDRNGDILKWGGGIGTTPDTGTYILTCTRETAPQVMRWW